MNKKPKIKISEEAFIHLKESLKMNKEYSAVKFTYVKSCCRPKVEIYLDNSTEELIQDSIEDLPILYDLNFADKIKTITLIYKNSSFHIKPELYEEQKKDCSHCSNKSHSCGSCKRDGL